MLAERLTSQLSRVLGLYSRAESVAATSFTYVFLRIRRAVTASCPRKKRYPPKRGAIQTRDDNRDGSSETSCFGVSAELIRRQTTRRHCAKSREIDRSGCSSQISLIELVGESR